MEQKVYTITAGETDAGMRLDRFLTASVPELSRSRLQALIEQTQVSLDGSTINDASAKVKPGQVFTVTIPEIQPSHILPQAMALDIVYEDDHLLVINKPPGLTVHPAPGHADNTLVNALLAHCGDSLSGIGGVARPGIVHRIDKDTSGLLVVAKHDEAHKHLSAQLSERTLKRVYNAIVWGTPKNLSGTITGNIGRSPSNRQKMAVVKSGGKEAVTHYRVVSGGWRVGSGKDFSSPSTPHPPLTTLLECRLETGRTHQIRVHMMHIGHPLVGDPVYGQSTAARLKSNMSKSLGEEQRQALLAFERQALHAKELALIHPASGKLMSFSCELPKDMQILLNALTS